MAIPKITDEHIQMAIEYIDKNGIPDQNKSTKYDLVLDNGNKYPPKYVIYIASKVGMGNDAKFDDYNAVEAKNYFETRGYKIETKQEKFEMTITADEIVSTDVRFTVDNLTLGDNYKPIDVYFQPANGEAIRRKRNKSENKISNQTLPRLACQIFESQLNSLSDDDKKSFPVCRYTPKNELICGLFPSEAEYKKYRKSMEMTVYKREGGPQFVFYSWNLFSTLLFVKECLARFGNSGDKFVFTYRDKTDREKSQTANESVVSEDVNKTTRESKNPYSKMLLESKNIIFRGAPGTGKSHLAKEIAADIISNGFTDQYSDLSDEQKQQVEFVQFHPSYDYSDFVEGLRPKMNNDGSIGFELQDGVFKRFVARARKNYEDSFKSQEDIEMETSTQEAIADFFSEVVGDTKPLTTVSGNEFFITNVEDGFADISIPKNELIKSLRINLEEIKRMIESGVVFEKIADITRFLGVEYTQQKFSYELAIYKQIMKHKSKSKTVAKAHELKKYIFIIDEINRGEISKILGELFFSIDPGYRGRDGEVSTQYANMHANPNEKFYIPDNVYIIGTMNDIDRSVDSFDFAMRRRFRFIEIRAEQTQNILEALGDGDLKNEAEKRMDNLNKEILNVEDLNENYQIGAAYFLKLKTLSFDELWTDSLKPLLHDYVRGMHNEESIMDNFARAYGYTKPSEGDLNEAAPN